MIRVAVPFPVVPGKTADDVKRIAEEFRRRPDEYGESRRRLGVTLERAYLQTTPMGMFVVAYTESAAGFGQAAAAIARSDLDLDRFFVRTVKEVHGVDLTQPPQGEPPETVGEWVNPHVTERIDPLTDCFGRLSLGSIRTSPSVARVWPSVLH